MIWRRAVARCRRLSGKCDPKRLHYFRELFWLNFFFWRKEGLDCRESSYLRSVPNLSPVPVLSFQVVHHPLFSHSHPTSSIHSSFIWSGPKAGSRSSDLCSLAQSRELQGDSDWPLSSWKTYRPYCKKHLSPVKVYALVSCNFFLSSWVNISLG